MNAPKADGRKGVAGEGEWPGPRVELSLRGEAGATLKGLGCQVGSWAFSLKGCSGNVEGAEEMNWWTQGRWEVDSEVAALASGPVATG